MVGKHRTVAVGGTFDLFHKGHKALLIRAMELGKHVLVGVASDEFANRLEKKVGEPYKKRSSNVEQFFKEQNKAVNVEVVVLNDYFGPPIFTDEVEAIVVSEETLYRVELANQIRMKKGLKNLRVEVVEMVLAEDGRPISSTRIRRGEIDSEGRCL